jgi:TrmH family RNA methyltransferase
MGALFRVPLLPFEDAPRPWVALVTRGAGELASIESGSYVLGSEREGLPDDVLARCDGRATIPIEESAESLNVAMAGTIALYEASRRASQLGSDPAGV